MRKYLDCKPVLLISIVVIFVSGCSTPLPPAEFKHELFDEMGINTIAIMPILDRRSIRTDLELNDNILDEIKPALKKNGYEFSITEKQQLVENLSLYDFIPQHQPIIQSLELPSDQWLMFLVVKIADSESSFSGQIGNAHLLGYIYNKNTGEKVWEGVGIGASQNGFLFAALSDDEALERAARIVAQKIPKNLSQ